MFKKLLLTAAIAATAMVATAGCGRKNTEVKNYPGTLIITEVNEATDTVTAVTASGIEYQFSGIGEDWYIGDLAATIMSDNGTPESIRDDVVLSARYVGFTELYDLQELEAVEHQYE